MTETAIPTTEITGDLRAYVEAHIFDPDQAAWEPLMAPRYVDEVQLILIDIKRQTENSRAEKKAELEAFRARCLAAGPAGRAAFSAAKAEYLDWHRRAMLFTRAIEHRLANLKGALKRKNIETAASMSRAEHAALWSAIRALTTAVGRHRDEIDDQDASEVDEELWAELSSIAVRRDTEMVTLEDLLAQGFRKRA